MKKCFKPLPLSASGSAGLLILRIVSGLAFMHHGFMKIQHPFSWAGPDAKIPGFLLALAAISEFGGGLAWVLGLLTPLASFGIACTMSVAVYMHAFMFHDPFVASAMGQGSYEPALLYFCVALLLMMGGPGRFSLDRIVFGERVPSSADSF